MDAHDFETYEEMVAWEKELEQRISVQVGELPVELAFEVYLSEHAGEWALAALDLLTFAFANNIHVDSNLVKPAIDFWGRQFFPDSHCFMFAGRWLNSGQIEEVFEFPVMSKSNLPEEIRQQLLAHSSAS